MRQPFQRAEIEDFLYQEAALLDAWMLPEWLALFTADATYKVPSASLPPGASSDETLFYIADDAHRLKERVNRLMKKTAFSEYPRSKTRHLVSNVRIMEQESDTCRVNAAFVVYRSKMGVTDTYIGGSEYALVCANGDLRIKEKRCNLDLESLRPQGRISIIL
jgi:p-cumate 2,3-dioxygenase beta subunit